MLVGLLGVALGLVGDVLGGLGLGGGVLGVGVGDGPLLFGDRLGVLSGQDDEAGGGVGVGGAELDGVVGRVGDLFGGCAGVDGGLGGDVLVAGGLRRGRECLARFCVRRVGLGPGVVILCSVSRRRSGVPGCSRSGCFRR
ncbi:hypothetical protein [Streptomyces mirabilis]|uniref:hypothetical protein n=1 Tax=Streptomyces mirabilis TaxID=68239 RepID=UPI003667265E